MPNIFKKFHEITKLYRERICIESDDVLGISVDKIISATEAVIMGRKSIILGSNNYLGLTFNTESIEKACNIMRLEGTGTTGSRVASGSYSSHKNLEKQIAAFFGCSHAMLFSTGYQANVGFISAIAGKNDVVLIDSDSHASIYDGCRLSHATTLHFRHNDSADLERRLKRLSPEANKLIIVEGIYSMLGDRSPIREIVAIAKRYGAYVAVDEAHSLGVLGKNGRGLVEEQGVGDGVDFITGTFSKSVGTIGGFCVSNHKEIEGMRLVSRPYIFTASLPPPVILAASTSLERIQNDASLRDNLWRNTIMLYDGLKELGFIIGQDKTPVIAVYMPDIDTCARFWHYMIENGIYVNLAVPPATANNVCLLRCSVSSAHTKEQLEKVLNVFAKAKEFFSLEEKSENRIVSESHHNDRPSTIAAMHQ